MINIELISIYAAFISMMTFGLFFIKRKKDGALYTICVVLYTIFRWWPYFVDHVEAGLMWVFYPLSAVGVISFLLLLRIIDASLRSRPSIAS